MSRRRYRPAELARQHPEPAPAGRRRTATVFAADHARVVHSPALRALAGKPQALDVGEGLATRTRLAHSVEVARIARALGVPLGADPYLLETAGLAHDLGHPPFGHTGEQALDVIARPAGGYNANAQVLRILTRLAPGPHPDLPGLNLTRATLAAACKYPWTRQAGQAGFGAYDDDQPALAWIRAHHHDGPGPVGEARIVEWADDIANAVADLDDALRAGLLPLGPLVDPAERAALAQLAAERLSDHPAADLTAAAAELTARPPLRALARTGRDGGSPPPAQLSHLAHTLTGHYISETIRAARQAGQPVRGFTVPPHAGAEVAWLRALILRHVLRAPARRARRATQRQLLADLAGHLTAAAPAALDPASAAAWRAARDDAGRLRAIVDHLAGLPDAAIPTHPVLTGRRR